MDKNRQELLRALIEKFSSAMKNMHAGQSFPFGDFMLSHQQIMILFFIAKKKGGASVKELAKFINVTPGAITQFVDGLVEKKLVGRKEDARDRRSTSIKLTPAAAKKFNRFEKDYFVAVSLAFDNLSSEELEQFGRLVGKIKKVESAKIVHKA